MLDPLLRPLKDGALDPFARLLGRIVSPEALTLTAFAVGLGACAAAYFGAYWLALGLWLGSRVLDGLDGAVARVGERASDFGGYLDMLLDVVVYALLPIAVALSVGRYSAMTMAAVLLGAFYVNIVSWLYLSALIEKRRGDLGGGGAGEAAGAFEAAEAGKAAGAYKAAEAGDAVEAYKAAGAGKASGAYKAAGAQTSIDMPTGLMEGTETIAFFALFLIFPQRIEYLFGAMAALTTLSAAQRLVWALRNLKRVPADSGSGSG